MTISRMWEVFVCEYWSKITLMNKALAIASKNASLNKGLPFWVKMRLRFWTYGSFIFWTMELPNKIKIRKLEKRLALEKKANVK